VTPRVVVVGMGGVGEVKAVVGMDEETKERLIRVLTAIMEHVDRNVERLRRIEGKVGMVWRWLWW